MCETSVRCNPMIWGATLESGEWVTGSRAHVIVSSAQAARDNFDFVSGWHVPAASDGEALSEAQVAENDYYATLATYGILQ
jgi:hypothetical protein